MSKNMCIYCKNVLNPYKDPTKGSYHIQSDMCTKGNNDDLMYIDHF